jgi:hypothetical protein
MPAAALRTGELGEIESHFATGVWIDGGDSRILLPGRWL